MQLHLPAPAGRKTTVATTVHAAPSGSLPPPRPPTGTQREVTGDLPPGIANGVIVTGMEVQIRLGGVGMRLMDEAWLEQAVLALWAIALTVFLPAALTGLSGASTQRTPRCQRLHTNTMTGLTIKDTLVQHLGSPEAEVRDWES